MGKGIIVTFFVVTFVYFGCLLREVLMCVRVSVCVLVAFCLCDSVVSSIFAPWTPKSAAVKLCGSSLRQLLM